VSFDEHARIGRFALTMSADAATNGRPSMAPRNVGAGLFFFAVTGSANAGADSTDAAVGVEGVAGAAGATADSAAQPLTSARSRSEGDLIIIGREEARIHSRAPDEPLMLRCRDVARWLELAWHPTYP